MKPLRVLVAEDSEDDLLLVASELRAAGFTPTLTRVETQDELRHQLEASKWDLVISDYSMPQFDALSALEVLRQSPQREVPFIIVSGSIGEVRAVAALKAGAADYVMKDNLEKLVPVVERELRDSQIRRERLEAFEALRQAVKARDEFLSIASHELKTPLTALCLQLESLLKSVRSQEGPFPTKEAVLSKLEAAARSSDRLTDLVDRLLDITRLTAGPLELSREKVDLTSLANDVHDRLRRAFEDAGCRLSVRAPGPVVGQWDRERLENVITNLLTNALKFGAGRPVDFVLEDGDDTARMRVVDRGLGISDSDQKRIFERFERAVPDRHFGGFGVGLWLSRRIIEAHGGEIEVSSSRGQGSTFVVTLPKGPRQ